MEFGTLLMPLKDAMVEIGHDEIWVGNSVFEIFQHELARQSTRFVQFEIVDEDVEAFGWVLA